MDLHGFGLQNVKGWKAKFPAITFYDWHISLWKLHRQFEVFPLNKRIQAEILDIVWRVRFT